MNEKRLLKESAHLYAVISFQFDCASFNIKQCIKRSFISISTGSGGIDGETIYAPLSGYYHVVIKSGDNTQGRSSGRAYLKSYY